MLYILTGDSTTKDEKHEIAITSGIGCTIVVFAGILLWVLFKSKAKWRKGITEMLVSCET